MKMIKQLLLLDNAGTKGLTQAVVACTITSLSLMIPFTITIQVFIELLKPFEGKEVSWSYLWMLFGIGVLVFIFIYLLSKNEYRKTYVNSYTQAEETRLCVAQRMRNLPMSFFNSKDLSELSSNLMSDCSNIEQMMSSVVPQLIANIISIIIICLGLSFIDWRLSLSVFVTLPIVAIIFVFSQNLQKSLFKKHVDKKLEATKQSQEYLEGIKVIRACGLGGKKFKVLDGAYLELKKASMKVELVSGSILSIMSMVLRSGLGIVIFVGIHLLLGGDINFLTVLMFLLIATRVYGPILTVLTMLPDMLYLKVSSKRLRTLMEAEVMDGDKEIQLTSFDIEFAHVDFAYNNKDVLKDISFVAPEGNITALVGTSGSGKSTVAKLSARFWDTKNGIIKVGGVNVKDIDPETLMNYVSFVFQDVILFNDTIEQNIRIGNPNASEAEVHAAAKAARCDEFIDRLPNGYNTMLGENGETLSGGERQRISIARALLKDAPIILLDEATAALDPESEVLVQQAIGKLIKGKTVLVIAHRLRTIVAADQIIVLEDGRIIEQGSHNNLIKEEGLYKKLYQIQQQNLSWDIVNT